MFVKIQMVAKIQRQENSLIKISTQVSANLQNLDRNEYMKEIYERRNLFLMSSIKIVIIIVAWTVFSKIESFYYFLSSAL